MVRKRGKKCTDSISCGGGEVGAGSAKPKDS